MNQYQIMTLTLTDMIDFVRDSEKSSAPLTPPYLFDLSNRLTYDSIVSKVERYPETAFFHQALLVHRELLDSCPEVPEDVPEDVLLKRILFLDCNGVFHGTPNDDTLRIAEQIFVAGILIQHEKDGAARFYLPFDKSNSMAREARITFVESIYVGSDKNKTSDESFRKKLDKRICLGMDFSQIEKVNPSKFYAYRGLMLTAAKRVELWDLIGEEKPSADEQRKRMAKTLASSIIVIDLHEKPYSSDISVITATETSPDNWERCIEPEYDKPFERYDGEGLIGKDWSSAINKTLQAGSDERITHRARRRIKHTIEEYLLSADPLSKAETQGMLRHQLMETAKARPIGEEDICAALREQSAFSEEQLAAYKTSDAKIEAFLSLPGVVKDYRKFQSLIKRILRCKYGSIAVCIAKDLRIWGENKEARPNSIRKAFQKHTHITPDAQVLRSLCDQLDENTITSYQIRLPFGKGMLHEVDFQRFFKSELCISEDAKIDDAFGQTRTLSKAKIILTKSMFKCAAWLKKYKKDGKIECKSESGEPLVFQDPMEFYFYQCLAYDHGLYIANTNAMLHNDGTVKLNHQFLSTMDLTDEDIAALAKHQFDTIPQIAKQKMMFDDDIPETFPSDEVSLDRIGPPWARAYALCATEQAKANLLCDPVIRGKLRGTVESLERDVAIGRILVEGENRFLSHDLLVLMLDIAWGVKGVGKKKILEIRKTSAIQPNCYYMPNMKSKLPRGAFSAILRNPHLSRNEGTVAMRGYEWKNKYYETYLSHLDGLIMVSYDSQIPQAAGGADFDGDQVKVIHDPIVVNAIKKSVYNDRLGRTLYAIAIPKAVDTARDLMACIFTYQSIFKYPSNVHGYPTDFETIRNTFDTRVGQISNMAVRFAKLDAKNALTDADNHGNTDSAECTIITGLEIDAAKNGRRPSMDSIRKRLDDLVPQKQKKDYFIDFKDKFPSLPRYQWEAVPTENGGWGIICRGEKIFTAKRTVGDPSYAPLDSLPWHYCSYTANEKSAKDIFKERSPGKLYKFDQTNQEAHRDKEPALLQIMQAYAAVLQRASEDFRHAESVKKAKKKAGQFESKIITILRLQYDSLYNRFSETNPDNILDVYQDLYGTIHDFFSQKIEKREGGNQVAVDAVVEAIEALSASYWAIMDDASKKTFLEEQGYLSLQKDRQRKEAQIRMLTNFSDGGYKILYYVLKSIKCVLLAEDLQSEDDSVQENVSADREQQQPGEFADESAEEEQDAPVCPASGPYADSYMQLYRKAMQEKKSGKDWREHLIETCKTDLAKLFGEQAVDWNYVMEFVCGQRKRGKADQKGDFFWNVIPPEVIAAHVISEEEV